MRAVFVIRQMAGVVGGAEKAVLSLAKYLDRKGHDVTILTFDKYYGEPHYEVSPGIKIINLNSKARSKTKKLAGSAVKSPAARNVEMRPKATTGNGSFLKKIFYPLAVRIKNREFIKGISDYVERHNPDVVTVFMASSATPTILALKDKNVAKIFASRVTPAYDLVAAPGNDPNRIKKDYILSQLRHFDRIAVLIPSYKYLLPSHLQGKVQYIPNDVPFAQMQDTRETPLDSRPERILYVGRLEEYKGAMILLKAFALIAKEFPNWGLDIYGDGPLRASLLAFIEDKDLSERVRLVGVVKDVEQAYRSAQVFCLPSTHEGFSRSLSEAMACGMACLGFESCDGVKYLLYPDSGLLLHYDPSGRTLANALEELLSSAAKRKELGNRGAETIRAFDEEQVFFKWEHFLQETISRKVCANRVAQ